MVFDIKRLPEISFLEHLLSIKKLGKNSDTSPRCDARGAEKQGFFCVWLFFQSSFSRVSGASIKTNAGLKVLMLKINFLRIQMNRLNWRGTPFPK